MNIPEASGGDTRRCPFDVTDAAVAVVGPRGLIEGWSRGAEALLGYRARDVIGQPATDLLATHSEEAASAMTQRRRVGSGWHASLAVHHRDGRRLELSAQACPLGADRRGASWLVVATDLATVQGWDREQAVLRGLFTQSPFGMAVVDPQLRFLMINPALERMDGVPARLRLGRRLRDTVPGAAGPMAEARAREVLETGEPLVTVEHVDSAADPHRQHVRSGSSFRLQDSAGRTVGVGHAVLDVTSHHRARQRLALVNEASVLIGSTLDLDRTVEELAEVLVPPVADFVAVDLLAAVLGEQDPEPVLVEDPAELRRTAHRSIQADLPEALVAIGEAIAYAEVSPQARCLATGRPVLDAVLDLSTPWLRKDPLREAKLRELGIHSHLVVPLRARGITVGVATLMRWKNAEAFDADDLLLVEELAARAAVCIDNARRFTREHRAALTLQRSLLPQDLPAHTAVEAAYRYLPADTQAGVGGDWFDVLSLSGGRVGLVVGDVVGHGMHAAATMGRLRTAVHTLADLDLPPDELLSHLDDLVIRLAAEEEAADRPNTGVVGATCLYCVYDPISCSATFARAGHPPPAIAHLHKAVEFPEIPAGPPLGLGGLPFESAELQIPDGCVLAFYTDGLITASADRDVETGFERLCFALAHPDRPLEEICDGMVRTLLPDRPHDDVAFLVARTHALRGDNVATWDLTCEPAAVGHARLIAGRQLADWDLDELSFTTELIVSELVTNAIRYGSEPISLRLIRDVHLICEVSDGSNTSPHLRRARSNDEGGRGLFLVAQFAQRWGTRYTSDGKTIWAEQLLPESAPQHPDIAESRLGVCG
ncbi:SpoIIE family protein phosphatase [Streptomyces sp. NPDC054933]